MQRRMLYVILVNERSYTEAVRQVYTVYTCLTAYYSPGSWVEFLAGCCWEQLNAAKK